MTSWGIFLIPYIQTLLLLLSVLVPKNLAGWESSRVLLKTLRGSYSTIPF